MPTREQNNVSQGAQYAPQNPNEFTAQSKNISRKTRIVAAFMYLLPIPTLCFTVVSVYIPGYILNIIGWIPVVQLPLSIIISIIILIIYNNKNIIGFKFIGRSVIYCLIISYISLILCISIFSAVGIVWSDSLDKGLKWKIGYITFWSSITISFIGIIICIIFAAQSLAGKESKKSAKQHKI